MAETPEIPEELPLADAAEATPSALEGEASEIAAPDEVAEIAAQEAAGFAAPEAVAEAAKENESMLDVEMLDVNVPHAKHTWKDFIIHIGTITVGLLIAIGLEQSVEKLHHLRQRHELEAALRAEGDWNKSLSEANFQAFDDSMTWRLGLHQDIQTMLATGGKANLPYRVLHHRPAMVAGRPSLISSSAGLSTAAWDTAAEDNRLTLLPDDLAAAYSRLYSEEKGFADAQHIAAIAEYQQSAFEGQFADIRTPRTPVLAKMNAGQLQQYDALVMEAFTDVRREKAALTTFYGSNNAMLDGTLDLVRGQREAKDAYPDDYDKMAREIEREDAERDGAAATPANKGAR